MSYYPLKLTKKQREEIEELLGVVSDLQITKAYSLGLPQVQKMRKQRGIPPFRKRSKPPEWTQKQIDLLGTDYDRAIAERLGTTLAIVFNKRRELGIKSWQKQKAWW